MKKVQSFFQFLLGIALLALIGWGGYRLAALAVNYMSSVRKEIIIVLIFGSLILICSAIIIAAGQRGASKMANRSKDKEWKIGLYEEVTAACLSIFFAEDEDDKRPVDCAPLLDHLLRYEPQIALRGSAKVVRKYNEFKQHLVQADYIDERMARRFMELLLAFRGDLDEGKRITLDISDFQDLFGFKE